MADKEEAKAKEERQEILISAQGYQRVKEKLEKLKLAKKKTVDLEEGKEFLKSTENDITERNIILGGQRNSVAALNFLEKIFIKLMIDSSPKTPGVVRIGSKVKLKIWLGDNNAKTIEKVVDGYCYSNEVITTSSPLGTKLLNQKIGEEVSYQTNGGKFFTAKIIEIN